MDDDHHFGQHHTKDQKTIKKHTHTQWKSDMLESQKNSHLITKLSGLACQHL